MARDADTRKGIRRTALILVVVAIIGIVAIFVIPNFLDSLHKAKQKRTMADMHDVGKAINPELVIGQIDGGLRVKGYAPFTPEPI